MKEVLNKGAYFLVEFEKNALAEPRNGLYLNNNYSRLVAWVTSCTYV
jgi:hypothetical protein